jgi:hypothetical protein
MDFSSVGFEWLMAPFIILLRTDRFLFLINEISFALMPGLIYSAFCALGISKRVACYWMWLIPTAYCFVLQAGSIGNDTCAAVYFLAAIVFALRAAKRSSWSDASLALLATALTTGAKASNLPLLLPLAFVLLPISRILLEKPIKTVAILAIGFGVSFVPIAASNIWHVGDWSGDPQNLEKFKLTKPVAGIIGNTMLLGMGAATPPVIPGAKTLTASLTEVLQREPLATLHRNYPRLELGIGEIPTEEGAGIGLGLGILILVSLFAWVRPRWSLCAPRAMIFGILSWVALVVLMMKLGNHGIARLVSPYYPVLVLPLLAVGSQKLLVRKKWWILAATSCSLFVLPAMLLSPARPLVPIKSLMAIGSRVGFPQAAKNRIERVYGVYGARNDQLKEVRDNLPEGCDVLGFAGTGDESEYSLWKPWGIRMVKDINPNNLRSSLMTETKGMNCIVGSDWGIEDRFHMSPEKLADAIGGRLYWLGKISTVASREAVPWSVIIPKSGKCF